MDASRLASYISNEIDSNLIPALSRFISVPSLSPDFDADWESNGLMLEAMNELISYVDSLQIQHISQRVLKEPGRPWLFFTSVPATDEALPTVLMYGHFDKQPHMEGWSAGLGPTSPVIKAGRIYGRGTADDGYAIPTCALIVKALQEFSVPHGKIVIIGENEEESDSLSLTHYINLLKPEIGDVDIVLCFDAVVLSYDRLWMATSLRGIINLDLKVKTLKAGVHSGSGSGIVPSAFRILQQLIGRIEDRETGRILLPELYTEVTPQNYIEKASTVQVVGHKIHNLIPLEDGVKTLCNDLVKIYIDNTYRPTLVVTGIEGLPSLQQAGNVLQPWLSVRLSIRIPPAVNEAKALDAVRKQLLRDPPYNAQVSITRAAPERGWASAPSQPWLDDALNQASQIHFGEQALKLGDGGSIPFIGFLGETFPNSQFIITGVCGADSNAHSVDENLDISYLKKLTCCMIQAFYIISQTNKPH